MYLKFNDLEKMFLQYLAKQYRYYDVTYSELVSYIKEANLPPKTDFSFIALRLSQALYLTFGKPLTNHDEEKHGFKLYKDYRTITELLQDDTENKNNYFPS